MSIKYVNKAGYIHTVNTEPKFVSNAMALIVAMGYYLIEVK
jgi:hypothetical protein